MENQFVGEIEFENLIKDLETTLRQKYFKNDENTNLEAMIRIITEKKYFKMYGLPLTMARKIRNTLVHNRDVRYTPMIRVNVVIYDKVKEFLDLIKNPPKILESGYAVKNIFSCQDTDKICDVIDVMVKNSYTHIPVYSGQKLVGIFSESTFVDIAKKEQEIIIDKSISFNEILECLDINDRTTETILFVDRNKNVFDIEEMFERYFKNNKRLAAIFITNTGKNTEPILGMITPWDILGKE